MSTTVWEQVTIASGDNTPRGSFEGSHTTGMGTGREMSSTPTAGAPSSSSSPQHGSALQQRKDEHAHRKRNRIVLSCVQCRRRKLKCDRQFPCSACTRRGAADECYYQRHDKGRLEESGVLEKRMEALEKLVRGLVGETALQQIKDGSYDPNRDTGNTSSGEDTAPLQPSTTSDSGPGTLDNLNLAMGQLTILPESEGGTLYVGGTSWDAVFAQFAELKQLLKQARDQGAAAGELNSLNSLYPTPASTFSYLPTESINLHADDEIASPHANSPPSAFPFSNSPPPSMSEILTLLPSQNLTQKLLEKFFGSLLPFYKVVHYGTFMKEYKEFLASPNDAKPGWIALLFTMLSSSAMMFSPTQYTAINDCGLTHEQSARKFQGGAKAALVHAQFLKSHTLNVIQALILLQLSVSPDDMAVSSWALHGATKNLALQMGLHREPSLFKIPEPEAEIRRRVWWCIYIQDRLSCINHGISVSWQDSDADCREPLIVNDDQLTPGLAEKRHTYPTGTHAPFCGMTLFFCQLSMAKILTHVIQIAFGLRRTNYSKIMKLDEEVEEFRRNIIPKCLLPGGTSFDPKQETLALVIKSFYQKAILLLHRPFIGRAHENPQFRWSRDRAVLAALTIVRDSIALFSNDNVLLKNHYAATPMLAHGLFPAPIALALDLYTWPDQPNAEPSRQALLDTRRVYLHLSSQFTPVKRLHKILNVLMGKAWEKAGLTLPAEDLPSRVNSIGSNTSTPSPIMPNFDGSQQIQYNPQGVVQGLVPTSMQYWPQTADPYPKTYDWNPRQNVMAGNIMPTSTATSTTTSTTMPLNWGANDFSLFSDSSSSSGYAPTPQVGEGFDFENAAWNQNEWDLFVNSMDLDPVVNGTSFL